MTVKIMVMDKDNKPLADVKVFVSWQSGGYSEQMTDSSGIADLRVSQGTANYIQVNGRKVLGAIWLKDGTQRVPDR